MDIFTGSDEHLGQVPDDSGLARAARAVHANEHAAIPARKGTKLHGRSELLSYREALRA